MGDEDLTLVQALQAGDDTALDELMARHQTALFGFIYRYVRNETDAAELTQETFVRAYFGIASFQPKARFVTWLYTIATNLCRDHARSRHGKEARKTYSIFEDEKAELPASGACPDQQAEKNEDMAALEAAIDLLPHDLKTALILTALEGLSHIEAAERLDTTPKTIEMRVYRARKRLESAIKEREPRKFFEKS